MHVINLIDLFFSDKIILDLFMIVCAIFIIFYKIDIKFFRLVLFTYTLLFTCIES
jgi:hypothetical protein